MTPSRSMLPLCMVALLAMLVAACGSDVERGGRDTADEPATNTSSETDEGAKNADQPRGTDEPTQREGDDPGEVAEQRLGSGAFALTPAIRTCLDRAGLEQDPTPPAGATIAWTHTDGTRLVVAASSEQALALAGELGTEQRPANVDGSTVSAGRAATVAAGTACLDA